MRAVLLILLVLFSGLQQSAAATTHRYARQGQVLEITLSGDFAETSRSAVRDWIESTADALAAVYGRWPRDYWRVNVRSTGYRGTDPVPWAQVNRGDPDTVSFYIDGSASYDRLAGNWTAYHEFSHLLIPYRGWGDMWFSEGLASYYQNLLQARHGVFDEREMWQRLHDGFIRGRSNPRPDLNLHELSERRYQVGGTMRMYWSGAWYFLAADTALRQRSGGSQSLDTVLQGLNSCCRDATLSARQIAERLDRLSGESLFLSLFDEVSASQGLPDFESLYQELGVTVRQGRVSLDQFHINATVRQGFAVNSGLPGCIGTYCTK